MALMALMAQMAQMPVTAVAFVPVPVRLRVSFVRVSLLVHGSAPAHRLVWPRVCAAPMAAVAVEQVHQGAGQQQQVRPQAGRMAQVFAQQVERAIRTSFSSTTVAGLRPEGASCAPD